MSAIRSRNSGFAIIAALLLVSAGAVWAQQMGAAEKRSAIGGSGAGTNQVLPGIYEDPLLRLLDPTEDVYPRGDQVSPLEMSSALGFVVPAPPRADSVPSELAGITPEGWISVETGEAALRYGNRAVITFSQWAPGQVPESVLKSQATHYGVGRLANIGGHTAWIVPRDSQAAGFPSVNVLHIAARSFDVTIIGTLSTNDLVQVGTALSLD